MSELALFTCGITGKLGYRSKADVQAASAWYGEARHYFCHACGAWHWSSLPMANGGRQS